MPKRFTIGDFVVVLGAGLGANLAALLLVVSITGQEEIGANLLFLVVVPAQLAGSFLALLWIRSKRRFDDLAHAYGLVATSADLKFLGLGAGLQIAFSLALQPLARAVGVEESPQDVVRIVQELQGPIVVLVAGLVIAVLVPVVEELTYRGLLLRLVGQRRSEWTAIVASSVFFALIHLAGLESYDREGVLAFAAVALPAFLVLGIVLGFLTTRHGRLGPAIFTHAGFDLLAFVLLVTAPTLLEGL